jgi:hypothetical protein
MLSAALLIVPLGCEPPEVAPQVASMQLAVAEEPVRDASSTSSLERVVTENNVTVPESLEEISVAVSDASATLDAVAGIIESADDCAIANLYLQPHMIVLRDLPAVQAKVILYLRAQSTVDSDRRSLRALLEASFNPVFDRASRAIAGILRNRDDRWTAPCRSQLEQALATASGGVR